MVDRQTDGQTDIKIDTRQQQLRFQIYTYYKVWKKKRRRKVRSKNSFCSISGWLDNMLDAGYCVCLSVRTSGQLILDTYLFYFTRVQVEVTPIFKLVVFLSVKQPGSSATVSSYRRQRTKMFFSSNNVWGWLEMEIEAFIYEPVDPIMIKVLLAACSAFESRRHLRFSHLSDWKLTDC